MKVFLGGFLQIIIPMSLYVTIECTKLIHIYLIHQDIEMFDTTCQKSVECRALNIPEELGQVGNFKNHLAKTKVWKPFSSTLKIIVKRRQSVVPLENQSGC